MTSAAFTIPAGVPFAQSLARGLKGMAGDDPLALAGMIVLLPTRRSARALTEAFLRVTEGQALLLPRLIALADIEQGQPEIAADLDDDGDDDETPPAIDWQRRRLILARLVMSRADLAPPPDQALALADGLAALIDETLTEERDFAALADLAPEQFAGHWQKTLEFLSIVTAHWPLVLDQENAIDPAAARIRALDARARRWRRSPPSGPVIAAGFVSADPALARLIRVVTELPQGRVVLPGLDQHLDNLAWDAIGPTHPQCGLKRLLDAIGVDRRAVPLWPWVDRAALAAGAARVRLLSEALRPAETTQSWRQDKVVDPAALAGIDRIACGTAGEEAEVIALALRAALETPGRTAALVTPDRGLARRVAAALGRWDVAVDDSAGRKLAETPVGIWLRLVAEAMAGGLAPRPLLAMLKHPLASGGRAPHEFRRMVRALEIAVLRGPRPAPGLDGLVRALEQTAEDRVAQTGIDKAAVRAWLADFTARLAPLAELAALRSAPLAALLRAHAEAAEAFAATDSENGGLRLWRGPDGEAAAELFATLEGPAGAAMPAIEIARYPALLAALMEGIVVRPLYGVHPRLSIWGLIEARLQQADLVILGGLNEGTWPALPGDEPWMSRPMREGFGLPRRRGCF
jgi:ATP-dependent helicase/nuclease subunit B